MFLQNREYSDSTQVDSIDKNLPTRRRAGRRSIWLLWVLIFPLVSLGMVCYEFRYLQSMSDNDNMALKFWPTPLSTSSAIRGHTIIVLIANYRDSKRCSETLDSIFSKAVLPDLISIGIYDQIFQNESSCIDTYCNLVGSSNCRRNQVTNFTIDAEYAKGPTVARYETEKMIQDEVFCLAIDSHLIFIKNWDKELILQYDLTENPKAIITGYPKAATKMNKSNVNDHGQLMCLAQIESEEKDAMVRYLPPIKVKPSKKPRLQSQLAGGFNFGTCEQAKRIRSDPYTPYLFHGEEYSRASRLWTHGYDFYAPSKHICFHWYEDRKVVWERDWGERYEIQQRSSRRVRHALGLPVSIQDFDMTDIQNFTLGKERTFEQWKKFSGIDPLAPFASEEDNQFNSCGELQLIH